MKIATAQRIAFRQRRRRMPGWSGNPLELSLLRRMHADAIRVARIRGRRFEIGIDVRLRTSAETVQ